MASVRGAVLTIGTGLGCGKRGCHCQMVRMARVIEMQHTIDRLKKSLVDAVMEVSCAPGWLVSWWAEDWMIPACESLEMAGLNVDSEDYNPDEHYPSEGHEDWI